MIHIEEIRAGMEVLGTSEKVVGVVDSVEGQEIVLAGARSDVERLRVPLEWVEAVGAVVRLHKSADELRQLSQRHGLEPPSRHPLAEEADHGPGTV